MLQFSSSFSIPGDFKLNPYLKTPYLAATLMISVSAGLFQATWSKPSSHLVALKGLISPFAAKIQ